MIDFVENNPVGMIYVHYCCNPGDDDLIPTRTTCVRYLLEANVNGHVQSRFASLLRFLYFDITI